MSVTKVMKLTGLNVRALEEYRETLGIVGLGRTFALFDAPPQDVLDELQNVMDRIRARHGGQHWEYRSLIAVRNKLATLQPKYVKVVD